MHELLDYEGSMLLDIHQDSSLLVVAEGLGMDTIVYTTLKLHSDPHNLLLVSNFRLPEAQFISGLLSRDNVLHPPSIITAEVNNKEREAMYKRGGVVFVTSRILVVDLLMNRMPASLVSGVLILRAHELQEASQENFAVRLLRERNPSIFIKAMSDNVISLTSGYNHAERLMIQLGIPKLVLWPRFNVQVVSCFEDTQPRVEELRVELTENMICCQSCILDLMQACIKELVDRNPVLDADDLSLENAVLPNFDNLVGLYLDPIWNQLSAESRRLVGETASLRGLLRILIESDACAFLNTLEGLRPTALNSLSGANRSHGPNCIRRSSRQCPSWFLMDQADRLLTAARNRVYSNYAARILEIEISPKWKALCDILKEISQLESCGDQEYKAQSSANVPTVLILVGREDTSRLLESFLRRGEYSTKQALARYQDPGEPAQTTGSNKGAVKKSKNLKAPESYHGDTLTQIYKESNSHDVSPSKGLNDGETDEKLGGSGEGEHETRVNSNPVVETPEEDSAMSVNIGLPNGCRKVCVSSQLLGNSTQFEVIIRVPPTTMIDGRGDRTGLEEVGTSQTDFIREHGSRLAYVLDALRPRYVVLFEPRVEWVRELEVHKARLHAAVGYAKTDDAIMSEGNVPAVQTVQALDVFFMFYRNSVEEQRYLTTLRREKEAFESLIKLSSQIVIPKDAFLPPSMYLGENDRYPVVIVDMREFRSELPALLHRQGLKVQPVTLSTGDYILAPHLCVERKSVSDLIGSLNSGRLYQQCTAMSRHYPNPVLLIEFSLPLKVTASTLVRGGIGYRGDGAIGFSLYTGRHSVSSSSELNSHHLLSKLTLLTIHFPNLRLIWSVTPYCTAELFAELKQGRAEPSIDKLPHDGEHLEEHNVEAVDMLLRLPGISWKNYRRVMDHASSILELSKCDLPRLVEILDSRECATKLYNFFNAEFESVSGGHEKTSDGLEAEPDTFQSGLKRRANGPSARGTRFLLAGRVKTRRGVGRGSGKTS
ncbi:unnamed protein product [Calicophoron daubneyi]|uniref:DNA repair endonuclease XPF n=1 Tax=Calicophoron daubneyi TaxID=300641 RepID=A0AAV2TFT6_CALDB